LISRDMGMVATLLIGCCGAALAIVAHRRLWRSALLGAWGGGTTRLDQPNPIPGRDERSARAAASAGLRHTVPQCVQVRPPRNV